MSTAWLVIRATALFFVVVACREETPAGPTPAASLASSAAVASSPVVATPTASASAVMAPSDAPSARGDAAACPAKMVLVEGDACPDARHRCLEWLDDPTLPYARCARYDRNVRCFGARRALRFCIDRDEVTQTGERLPTSDLSFVKAKALCHARGLRMCLESEWTFACEGEAMLPYPYGWERRPACNQDHEGALATASGHLVDRRAPAGSFPECVSPFGVRDLVGNVDELVARDPPRATRFTNVLKGGWWMPARNRCRPATGGHDDYFHELQIGTRCCADVLGRPPTSTPNLRRGAIEGL